MRGIFNRCIYLDPASARTHSAQALDQYSEMTLFGNHNHNKDSTQSFIRSTNQYLALCKHDHLQDLGISYTEVG